MQYGIKSPPLSCLLFVVLFSITPNFWLKSPQARFTAELSMQRCRVQWLRITHRKSYQLIVSVVDISTNGGNQRNSHSRYVLPHRGRRSTLELHRTKSKICRFDVLLYKLHKTRSVAVAKKQPIVQRQSSPLATLHGDANSRSYCVQYDLLK